MKLVERKSKMTKLLTRQKNMVTNLSKKVYLHSFFYPYTDPVDVKDIHQLYRFTKYKFNCIDTVYYYMI